MRQYAALLALAAASGCEMEARAYQPPPEKIVVRKITTTGQEIDQNALFGSLLLSNDVHVRSVPVTKFLLVAADASTCEVSAGQYALADSGRAVRCDWVDSR